MLGFLSPCQLDSWEYLDSNNSDLNCESLVSISSNTPLTFASKERSSITIILQIIVSVVLILFNCSEHIGVRAIFCQWGGGGKQFAQNSSRMLPKFSRNSRKEMRVIRCNNICLHVK